MDRVIASILMLIAAFILQHLWQYYRTMTDEDGVVIGVDVAETVTHRDEPQVLSVQVFIFVVIFFLLPAHGFLLNFSNCVSIHL